MNNTVPTLTYQHQIYESLSQKNSLQVYVSMLKQTSKVYLHARI